MNTSTYPLVKLIGIKCMHLQANLPCSANRDHFLYKLFHLTMALIHTEKIAFVTFHIHSDNHRDISQGIYYIF